MGDLAEQRMSLVHERALARRSIATGAALLASIVLVIGLSVFMTDTLLLVASVYILLALIFGTRWFVYGVLMHGVISLKLRKLHARDTGLPPARLL